MKNPFFFNYYYLNARKLLILNLDFDNIFIKRLTLKVIFFIISLKKQNYIRFLSIRERWRTLANPCESRRNLANPR
jgi:hypothetical protein